jgi:hypothetical protein
MERRRENETERKRERGEKRQWKKNNESEGSKRTSREDILNGERYTSAFSPSSTQARIAPSSRNI